MDTINKSHTLYLEPYDPKRLSSLCGYCGENLKLIENRLNVEIRSRGNYFEVVTISATSKIFDALSILKTLYEDAILDSEISPNSVHLRILEQLETAPAVIEDDLNREFAKEVVSEKELNHFLPDIINLEENYDF